MKLIELLHKRVLLAEKNNSYGSASTVREYLFMEVSPSGNFVKIRDMDGRRYWKASADIQPIEILASIETAPQKTSEAVVNSI